METNVNHQWQVLEIPRDSVLYPLMLELRKAELREPLGLICTKADLAAEADQRHFILVNSESHQVVGCALLVNISANIAKVRQVAIAESLRGKGLGRILMNGIESAASHHGFQEIQLHARETAVQFYERLDYEIIGDSFIEVGLPHFLMRKDISATVRSIQ